MCPMCYHYSMQIMLCDSAMKCCMMLYSVILKRVCVIHCARGIWVHFFSMHIKLMHKAISRDNTIIYAWCFLNFLNRISCDYTLFHFIVIHTYPELEAFLIQIFCKFTRLNCVTKWRLKYEFTCTKNQGNWQFKNHDSICVHVFLSLYLYKHACINVDVDIKSWSKNDFTYMYII